MVARSFFALDNESLVVDSSSNAAIVGNPIINNSDTPDGTIFTYTGGFGTTVTLDDDGAFADAIPEDNNLFFNDDEAADHIITDGGGIVANGNQVEAESLIELRALDAGGSPIGPVITLTVFSQNGVTQNVWGFSSDVPLEPGVSYVKVGGSNAGDTLYTDFITCFGPGTTVKTPYGEQAVETIQAGQMVWTLDQGYCPVIWASSTEVHGQGAFAPVVFAPGSIGNSKELRLSQEHRVYLRSAKAELLFGTNEVLIAAKHLCGLPGVTLAPQPTIRYTHFMFDRHQVVRSNGALTESFFLSEHSVVSSNSAQQRELTALFPCLSEGIKRFGGTAALALKKYETCVLQDYLTEDAFAY
ncbi:MAG: Hint domain-containing protein [Pseudomonadota bacterium]